jgi:hypothetical protein
MEFYFFLCKNFKKKIMYQQTLVPVHNYVWF